MTTPPSSDVGYTGHCPACLDFPSASAFRVARVARGHLPDCAPAHPSGPCPRGDTTDREGPRDGDRGRAVVRGHQMSSHLTSRIMARTTVNLDPSVLRGLKRRAR